MAACGSLGRAALVLVVSAWVAGGSGLAGARRAAGQEVRRLEVVADTSRVTVGDPVTLTVRVATEPGATLLDRSPRPRAALPDGFRILSADSLAADGTAYTGRIRVAFFRPGQQSVPALVLTFRPAGAPGAPDTLVSSPVAVEVVPVLPPGEQTLKDIKDLQRVPARPPLLVWLAVLAAGLLLAYLVARRFRRRPVAVPVPAPPAPPPDPKSAYARALERLAQIERERLPERGEVAGHYELVADVLRRYLEEGPGAPALERTTAELAWALPPALAAGGLRDACRDLLEEADLVKFARVRPGTRPAADHLVRARALLDRWHTAGQAGLVTVPAGEPLAETGENGEPSGPRVWEAGPGAGGEDGGDALR